MVTVQDEMYTDFLRRLNELARLNDMIHVEPDGTAQDRKLIVDAIDRAVDVAACAAEIYRLYGDESALQSAVEHDEMVESLIAILTVTDQNSGLIGQEIN